MTFKDCPSCGTEMPEGANRCPGCGRVFGEQNRCPSCHAIAPAMERKGKLICAACGAPRSEGPDVAVLAPASKKGKSISLRILGFSMLLSAAVFAGVAALVDQYTLALILGAGFALPGWLSLRRAQRVDGETEHQKEQTQLRAARELMADHAGRVTAAQVAKKLGVQTEEADALLTRAAKQGNFEVDFDDEGQVYYLDPSFSPRGARVRVESAESSPDELELSEAETSARKNGS